MLPIMGLGVPQHAKPAIAFLISVTITCLWSTANCESRFKRQSALALQQPSYTFCAPSPFTGTYLGQVSVPTSSNLQYSISTNTPSIVVNPNNGQLYIANDLTPGSSVTFTLQATDNSGRTATTQVTIQTGSCLNNGITTTTTSPPIGADVFERSSYQVTLTNCAFATLVGIISVKQGLSRYTYSLDPSSVGSNFYLVSDSGQLYLIGSFTGTTRFNVVATSATGVQTSVPVTVTNACKAPEAPAVFRQPSYSFTPASCSSRTQVGQVSATADAIYTIDGVVNQFSIDGTTGAITLASNLSPGIYNIVARLQTLNADPTDNTATVQVTCPQPLPVFRQSSYSFSPSSCLPGTQVGQVSATTDAIFAIDAASNQFAIDGSTGAITMASNLPAGTYTFVARLQTQNGNPTDKTATVQIICPQQRPAFSQPVFTFTPSSCSSGAQVGQMSATGKALYTVDNAQVNRLFSIDRSTGSMKVTDSIPPNGSLPPGPYSFLARLLTLDGGSTDSTASIRVTCPARAVSFTQATYQFVPSSCSVGGVVGTVGLLGQPIGAQFSLSPAVDGFAIDSNSGTITMTKTPTGSSSNLRVQAITPGGTTTATVAVQFDTVCTTKPWLYPVFGQKEFLFSTTNCGFGSNIGQIYVTIPNTAIRYSLTTGLLSFAIDPVSGRITTISQLRSGQQYEIQTLATDISTQKFVPGRVVIQTMKPCSGSADQMFNAMPDFG